MKKIFSIISLGMIILLTSCGDPNDNFDMRSPQADIPVDTFEVNRGDVVRLEAVLTDDSGIESCNLNYSKWKVSQEFKLKELGNPVSYHFQAEITVPEDAEYSWLEDYQKHDGSIFKITQTYHKLSLTFYDTVKNKNVVYFYIKVKP